jgi:SAM-dependent MidA family methyltransferase
VEQGAGRGGLARAIVDWASRSEPVFAEALRYTIVEPIARLRDAQQRFLEDSAGSAGVTWIHGLSTGIAGVLLTNELLDAFPVHRVVRRGDELLEVYVGVDDAGGFVDHLAPPSTPELRAYFDALGLLPGEGCFAEVNLAAPRWIAQAADSLERGYVLTFDYGYEADDLYAPWRRDGTLLCFYKQAASSDPYQRIGRQDMTASIDLTTLRRAGEAAGLRTLGLTNQASFLLRMGINEGIANVARERPGELEEYLARRGVVMELVDPAGLGRIKVLLQGKNAPEAPLRGFRDD